MRLARPALALSAWTLFVWVNRVKNVLDDRVSVGGELNGWAFSWRLGVALGFCSLAVIGAVVVVAALRSERNGSSDGLSGPVIGFFRAFAGLGIAWWTIRGIGTLVADFAVGFKVVHTILALVTIGLGLVVLRVAKLGDRYG